MRGLMILVVTLGVFACKKADDNRPPSTGSQALQAAATPAKGPQVPPPLDLNTPPADAIRTASGLVYKRLVANDAGAQPKRNDIVMINYTGWRQSTGETFFTNRASGKALPLNLAQTAPGFTEALPLLHQGDKAVLWMPPSIGYKTPPSTGKPETLVYEVEVVEITSAPEIPADVAKPPATATVAKGGEKLVVVRPGTGKDKARPYDTVTFNYTAWDADGRMIDTTELRKRPVTAAPYKQSTVMAEMLAEMTAGERLRFWVDAEKMINGGKPVGGVSKGQLCYELEVLQIAKAEHEPPPTPPDVARPPADARKTAKGVSYRVLKAGPAGGKHPTENDSVKVHYTGWTTDGKMFDSSQLRGEPATFGLHGVIPGWTDGIPVMAVGDRVRFWIPEDLAYKGVAGKPAGMLVFDVELLEIVPAGEPAGHQH
jgi:FKBP-type peptidyl-prolyl cis-trans isomerase